MQSKTLVWAYLLILSLGTILSLYIPKNEAMAKESVVIPGDAIRLRILANSDTPSDQQLKRDVRDAVNAKITLWVKDLTSLPKARTVIHEKLPEIQAIAEKVVKDHGSTQAVHVKFGKVQFPTKLYGEFLYPAGEYQAILITLGKGEGANWWCVLYPPLCFLDFSNGVAVSNGFVDKQPAKSELDIKPKADETSADDEPSVEPKTVQASVDEEDSSKTSVEEQKSVEVGQSSVEESKSVEVGQSSVEEQKSVEPAQTSVEEPTNVQPSVEKPNNMVAAQTSVEESTQTSVDEPEKSAPVYTAADEEPVKVKFFIVELLKKLFD